MHFKALNSDLIQYLQKEVLSLQGLNKSVGGQHVNTGLGIIESAFPAQIFPTGAVHEFISLSAESAAATNGFISGLISSFMQHRGMCLWVSTRHTVFPPALKVFGIEPDRVIFAEVPKPKDALWVIEEALKCDSLAAVVGEVKDLSFTESRRLQLAVEASKVTGFIHRHQPRIENTVTCVTRWKIEPVASITEDGMPGLGFPRWNVQLLKVRNGKPGTWQVEWFANSFQHTVRRTQQLPAIQKLKAG